MGAEDGIGAAPGVTAASMGAEYGVEGKEAGTAAKKGKQIVRKHARCRCKRSHDPPPADSVSVLKGEFKTALQDGLWERAQRHHNVDTIRADQGEALSSIAGGSTKNV